MKSSVVVAALAGCVTLTVARDASAQQPPPPATEVGGAQLAIVNLPAKENGKLAVSSPAFKNMGDIPFENTQYKGNVFPGLTWVAPRSGVESYVIIMQDADALRNGAPILHWTAQVPGGTTMLEAGMKALPAGGAYGPNIRGAAQAFMGPHTPPGPKHRYHLQVFALDKAVPSDALASYETMIAAMRGHVLASGELVGLGQAPTP